ncbi:unnamed protein product, partial [Mesorhabditis spiculigera]
MRRIFIWQMGDGGWDLYEFSNIMMRKVEAASRYEEEHGPASKEYYAAQVVADLKPFINDGISIPLLKKTQQFGVVYRVINGSIYRSKKCTFPARCAGVEYFLKQIGGKLPDTQFVLNDHDNPKIPRGPLPLPLFSFSKDPGKHMDILYPAWAFWEGGPAISQYPSGIGKWDEMRKTILRTADRIDWVEKASVAFFLGSRTSALRDPLVLLSRKRPELADAQYTKNQAYKGPQDTLNYAPAAEKPFEENCRYKYLVNFRGVSASFRLKHLLLCNSVLLNVDDGMVEFFNHKLVPYFHYIPVGRNTEDEWVNLIQFLQEHDALAQAMAKRSQDWVRAKLTNRDVTNYWLTLLIAYTPLLKDKVVAAEGDLLIT